ncbi:MAG: XkdF-like putative serine protease domain-containing protein [Acidimicrobiales bacterium]
MVAVPSYIAANASRGLDLLEYAGDGLRPATIREARAMAGGNVSENKVTRMAAWFARHRGDLDSPRANEYLRGETDRPTPGQVAWLLWGGSLGRDRMNAMSWAERTRDRLEKAVSARVRQALQNKVDEHNEKHGSTASKRVTLGMLTAVFERGVGAFNTNPESVRPGVGTSDQWAHARVNTFLQAVRTGRYPSGKFDTDLLPEGHPLSTRKAMTDDIEKALPASYRQADDIRNCGNCKYAAALNNGLWCMRWDAEVQSSGMCDAWKPHHMHAGSKGYDDEEKGYGYDLRKDIVEEDGQFCVYSEDRGRRFGCYPTLDAAEERLAQIESFSRSLDDMTPEQLKAAHLLTEKAIGDELVDLARSIIEDRLETIGFAPPYTTGDTTEKLAALHHVVPFAKAEERYTLGPVYVPGRLDGHGEFIDADTLQKAIWDWVRSGDRTIFLQHSEKAAGEMVEILTWPMPIATQLSLPGEEIRKVEFPAETPFMGVVWESWAWDLIKAGQLRGYSIGGKARRVEADLSLTSVSE